MEVAPRRRDGSRNAAIPVQERLRNGKERAILYNGSVPGSPPSRWQLALLAHQRPEAIHRCLRLRVGQGALYLCARCVGLYPALAAAAAARLALPGPPGALGHPALRLGVPLAGGAAWVAEQAGIELGRPLRVLSGALLGLGLGWAIGLHLVEPWPVELMEIGAALALVAALGMLARRVTIWQPGGNPELGAGPRGGEEEGEHGGDRRAEE